MLRLFLAKMRERLQRNFAAPKSGAVFAVAAMAAVGLSVAGAAHAADVSMIDTVGVMFAGLIQYVVGFVGQLLLVMVSVLLWVAQYNGFVNSVPVVQGWSIVRDIANMFFIVIMLILAFGTILGSENYSYKGRLFRVLLMAVIVNFSRTICGLLIDMSQVVMLTFVYGFKEAAGGNFVDALRLTKLMQIKRDTDAGITPGSIVIGMLLALLMVTISLVVVTIMTVTLVVRMVWLWLLVVLSPLAFMVRDVPGSAAKSYYGKWWSLFTGQLLVGPVLAFFLWLSLISVSSPDFLKKEYAAPSGGAGSESVSSDTTEAFADSEITSFTIAICLLLGGLKIANTIANNVGTLKGAGGTVTGYAKGAYGLGRTTLRAGKGVGKAGLLVGGGLAAGTAAGLKFASGGRVDLAKGAKNLKQKGIERAATFGPTSRVAQGMLKSQKEEIKAQQKDAAADAAGHSPDVNKFRADKKGSNIQNYENIKARLQDLTKMSKKGDLTDDQKQEFTEQSQRLRDIGSKFRLDKETEDFFDKEIYKKNPALAVNADETDPLKIAEQARKYSKMAQSINVKEVGDLNANAIDERFMANQTAARIMAMQKEATGEQLEKLLEAGNTESEINDYLERIRTKPENFAYISDAQKNKMLGRLQPDDVVKLARDSGMSGAQMPNQMVGDLAAFGALAGMADQVSQGMTKDRLESNPGWAQQLAEGISGETLRNLPDDVAAIIRAKVGETRPEVALRAGAAMEEVFNNFNEDDSSFGTDDGRQKFNAYLDGGKIADRVGDLPASALLKNGGINEVALASFASMSADDLRAMGKAGKAEHVSAMAQTAFNLQNVGARFSDMNVGIMQAKSADERDRLVKEKEQFLQSLPMSEDEINAMVQHADQIIRSSEADISPATVDIAEKTLTETNQQKIKVAQQVERSARKARERQERDQKALDEKVQKYQKRLSRRKKK